MKYVLYFYISTSRSLCEVPNMAVLCSSLILCFPGMLLRYCLSDFEIVVIIIIITTTSSSSSMVYLTSVAQVLNRLLI